MSWFEPEQDRIDRFTPMNDRIWGQDNWIRCLECPKDAFGHHVFHHKDAHSQKKQ